MSLAEHFNLKFSSPSIDEFVSLRAKVGWQTGSLPMVETSLNNSLFHVTVYDKAQLIGMGRVIGDGAMYFYVQDVVVDPQYQNLGIGAALMEQIEIYLAVTAKQGSTIGLLAAKGKEAFYQRYNYIERPNTSLGKGMCKFL